MKLALYSGQVGESKGIDDELLELISNSSGIFGYIPSSSDPDRRYYSTCQEAYARLGITLDLYFELDQHFEPEKLTNLLNCDGIHLSGGNTYYFLHWIRERGLASTLVDYVERGGIIVGVSAGAMIMTPDISAAEFCGDVNDIGLIDTSGLGLIGIEFLPHFGERADASGLCEISTRTNRLVYACRDGEGIIISGDDRRVVGNPVCALGGKIVDHGKIPNL
jgi:dipeptidase E